jgi:lipopolysaccharide assembly outer membrane protein LptD (OstA)
MGVRLELILLFLIVLFFAFAMRIKLQTDTPSKTSIGKELEFTDTTLVEVTTQDPKGVTYLKHGTRENGILHMDGLEYHDPKISLMSAKHATFEENTLYLEGNISLFQENGFRFMTQKASYNRSVNTIYVTTPFTAYLNQNRIVVEEMQYNMNNGNLYAQKVRANIQIVDTPENEQNEEKQ